jgi:TRAP-type uncharacterized transport system substrate-binding protein
MIRLAQTFFAAVLALHAMAASADAQQANRSTPRSTRSAERSAEVLTKEKLNAWTVGLAGGLLEGAPLRFATEIARVVDDGENMHVLPIVTRGPSENVESLLYLRGVDVGIINADALEEFRTLVPNIDRRIVSILSLFQSELHIFVRPEINSLEDLKGKKVNFNTPGTSAAYSGPLIFDRLKIDVQKTFIPHQVALEQMRKGGDMAAVVFVTSKPVDAFARSNWDPGFKFLPVPYDARFEDHYLPASLSTADYPQLIKGDQVQTIAVPTILAAYNWPRSTERYRRVSRFIDYLYNRIDKLHEAGFHPKWKDVNLSANVPGLMRAPAAQEWLDRVGASSPENTATPGRPADADAIRAQAERASGGNPAEADRLFREFMEWRRTRQ